MALAGRNGIRHTVRWQTPHLGIEVTIDSRHTNRLDFMVEADSRGGVIVGIDRLIEKLIEAREMVRQDVAA